MADVLYVSPAEFCTPHRLADLYKPHLSWAGLHIGSMCLHTLYVSSAELYNLPGSDQCDLDMYPAVQLGPRGRTSAERAHFQPRLCRLRMKV
jgi:hypothetical protein